MADRWRVPAWVDDASSGQIRSVAVLPLENLSGDPEQEYFADGMTEQLIADLATIGGLRVISRTSVMQYRKAPKPVPAIARELQVDAIIEGSVVARGRQGANHRQTDQGSHRRNHLGAELRA